MFKKRSKFFAYSLVAILTLVALVSLVACGGLNDLGKPNTQDGVKQATIIIGAQTYSVQTEAEYLHDALLELKAAGKIEYEFTLGEYGAFVTKLNELEGTANYSKWIGVYVDSDDSELASPGYDETVDGKVYHSANLGVSDMPLLDGLTYVFLQK